MHIFHINCCEIVYLLIEKSENKQYEAGLAQFYKELLVFLKDST